MLLFSFPHTIRHLSWSSKMHIHLMPQSSNKNSCGVAFLNGRSEAFIWGMQASLSVPEWAPSGSVLQRSGTAGSRGRGA